MAMSKRDAKDLLTRSERIVYDHATSKIDRSLPGQKSFTFQELEQGATDGSFPVYINMKVIEHLKRAYEAADKGWAVEVTDDRFILR